MYQLIRISLSVLLFAYAVNVNASEDQVANKSKKTYTIEQMLALNNGKIDKRLQAELRKKFPSMFPQNADQAPKKE